MNAARLDCEPDWMPDPRLDTGLGAERDFMLDAEDWTLDWMLNDGRWTLDWMLEAGR